MVFPHIMGSMHKPDTIGENFWCCEARWPIYHMGVIMLMSSWKGSLNPWWHIRSCDLQKLWRRSCVEFFSVCEERLAWQGFILTKACILFYKRIFFFFFHLKSYHFAVQKWLLVCSLLQVHVYFCEYEWFMQIHAKHILHVILYWSQFILSLFHVFLSCSILYSRLHWCSSSFHMFSSSQSLWKYLTFHSTQPFSCKLHCSDVNSHESTVVTGALFINCACWDWNKLLTWSIKH